MSNSFCPRKSTFLEGDPSCVDHLKQLIFSLLSQLGCPNLGRNQNTIKQSYISRHTYGGINVDFLFIGISHLVLVLYYSFL